MLKITLIGWSESNSDINLLYMQDMRARIQNQELTIVLNL